MQTYMKCCTEPRQRRTLRVPAVAAAIMATFPFPPPCLARHNRVMVASYTYDSVGRLASKSFDTGGDTAGNGNRWSNFAGLGQHDDTARWHDAVRKDSAVEKFMERVA